MIDQRSFVKSAGTSTSASVSRGHLEAMLRRYGCSGFGVHTDYATDVASVTFRVPDTGEAGAREVPVRLQVNIRRVYDSLYGGRKRTHRWNEKLALEQAERVAWRQLTLWVDAALSAAATGLQPISEAFMASTLVEGPKHKPMRLAEYLDVQAGGPWQKLLPAKATE
jgi:hypothetical protein